MHLCAALAVLTALVGTSHATSYYVATTGDDSAAGTQSAPFLTVQKCASTAAAGDACVLRGGRYPAPATVSGLAGEGAGEGLTIAGFGGEDAVIDGSMALSGDAMKWTKASASASASSTGVASCIYRSAPYDREATVPWQLFLGDRPLTPARWPNARLDDLSVFAPHNLLNGSGPLAYSAKNSTFGELVDDDTSALAHSPSLAESGIDFTGTMVVLPLGVMGADPRGCLVTRHGAGAGSLSYTPPTGSPKSLHSNNPYFFEGHPKLLDAAAEWSFDQKTRELMVWLPGCADPNKAAVRGKVRGFNLNATKSQMNLKDLTLFATTFGATNSGVSLLNVTMNCPTFNKRGIGECGPTGETWLHIDKRRSFRMENSSVFFSDGPSVFNRYGDNAVLTNNLFRGSCYAVGSSASLDDHNGPRGLLFERNTIEHFNCFTAITPGYDATIRLNRFRHQGSHTDGAGVHVHIGPQNGVVIEQNWFHDITNKALRFDRVNSPTATCKIPEVNSFSNRCC